MNRSAGDHRDMESPAEGEVIVANAPGRHAILCASGYLLLAVCLLLAGCLLVPGCTLLAPHGLLVEAVAVDAVAAPDNPAMVRVTATNTGSTTVTWGRGSSTCQLHLRVRIDGVEYFAPDGRVCTRDLRTHALGPGESRTEGIDWSGWIQRGEGPDTRERLAPGKYELLGAAGHVAHSAAMLIELR